MYTMAGAMESPDFERKADIPRATLTACAALIRYAADTAANAAEERAARLDIEAKASDFLRPSIRIGDAMLVLRAIEAIRIEAGPEMDAFATVIDECEEAMDRLVEDATGLLATETKTPN
jgi:hypothetical protein